jgi:hypothetical protein
LPTVVLGSRIRIMTAAKRFRAKRISVQRHMSQTVVPTLGLYSAFQACNVMVLRSRRQSGLTVATIFCNVGIIPSTAVMWCCASVRGAGVVRTALVGGVDGPATATDVVPLLVAEVSLAGWGWEGGGVCD